MKKPVEHKPATKHRQVTISKDLADRVDEVIEKKTWLNCKSKDDFAEHAILKRLEQLEIARPPELMLRWSGDASDFILSVIRGMESTHGRFLDESAVVSQVTSQGMPENLVQRTLKKLMEAGKLFPTKGGMITRPDAGGESFMSRVDIDKIAEEMSRNTRGRIFPKVKFGVGTGIQKPTRTRGRRAPEVSEEWKRITREVREWVESREGPQNLESSDSTAMGMSFDWGFAVINVCRLPGAPLTVIAAAMMMEGDDADFYHEVGEHDWRVFIRGIAYQTNHGEIEFDDGYPSYRLVDYLYDDSFSVDALYQHCRSIQAGLNFILIFIKNLKRLTRMKEGESETRKLVDRVVKYAELETKKDYKPGPHYI